MVSFSNAFCLFKKLLIFFFTCVYSRYGSLEGAELALENASDCTVRLNNVSAGGITGWYADHCIGKVALPDIRVGENLLEVSTPYGRRANPEAMYLGSFGVSVQGVFCAITKQPGGF